MAAAARLARGHSRRDDASSARRRVDEVRREGQGMREAARARPRSRRLKARERDPDLSGFGGDRQESMDLRGAQRPVEGVRVAERVDDRHFDRGQRLGRPFDRPLAHQQHEFLLPDSPRRPTNTGTPCRLDRFSRHGRRARVRHGDRNRTPTLPGLPGRRLRRGAGRLVARCSGSPGGPSRSRSVCGERAAGR